MSIDDIFRQRRAAAYVDPVPLHRQALAALWSQVPETMAALAANGYPSHGQAYRITYQGVERIAWVYKYAMPVVPKQPAKGSPVVPVQKAIAFLVDDHVSPPKAKFLHTDDFASNVYVDVDVSTFSAVVIYGIRGVLQEIAKPAKRKPWDE